ncbi:MAG: hypothetical protein AYP45_18070 [Candidatus Brocadia carolinensis]|uniref:Uncharacterized protein n=1 Tax=Candidatus Brocadia carolinensis TaxID=1004156 RepID=A0A1V4AP08_9BACT|nr:MAG: hypothetical protein AYP45_18070 [Candidatus Brocadia caroliniensis]
MFGPNTYEGKEKLYEYINGGAEPYLSYSFVRVVSAEYQKDTDKKILIDIWEFSSSEDAFGVFTKDRAGTDINLGNGSALFHNCLYLWNGTCFVRIEPREGDILPEEVTFVGKAIIDTMPYKKVLLPAVMDYLPEHYMIQGSQKFFHKKIILDNIYISDNFIEENVFRLSEKTDAVIAEYRLEANAEPLKLMLIQYPDKNVARVVFDDVVRLWRSWSEKEFTEENILTFQDKAHRYTSCFLKTNILCMTFLASNKNDGVMLLNLVRENNRKAQ